MIRKMLFLFLVGFGMVLTAQPVFAADQAKKEVKPNEVKPNVSMSTVLQNLKMNGYNIISKVDLDDAVFNIDAMTPQGKELSITMNAQSGEITSPKQNPAPRMSLVDAVKKVEGSGYHDISMVEYSGGKYVVKAIDDKGKKVKLKVDGDTGDITKPWF